MALSLDDRVTMSDDVVYRALGAEAIVLDLKSGVYFGLNDAGTRIWSLAAEHDLRTVCRHLAAEFEAASDVIERDVLDLISQLVDKQLVKVVTLPPRPAQ
ncbi:MAG TPA: PqqD family protein [Vicinamibacterales bacterium]|nr:PqqD family protein [Vicinamibacterales bacterium]